MNIYLLFHSLAEIFSVLIAWGIAAIAWNSRRYLSHSFFLFIGVAYAGIGGIDLLHTLAYSGMGVFPGATANLPTQLWIAARYLNAVAWLLAPLFLRRKYRPLQLVWPWAAATIALVTLVFSGWFPDCFTPEAGGLTTFKIASEYVICAIVAAGMVFLWRRRQHLDAVVLRLLLISMALTIAAELSFTLYVDVYGVFNALGHILKIVAFALLYQAIVVMGLQRPYQTLFRDLLASENQYRRLFNNMTEGFASHEIVTDAQDRPVDYRFLEVNPAFRALTGLDQEDIVGKRMLELLPNSPPLWVDEFGKVALTGEPSHFEAYIEKLRKWFEVNAYQSQPRQFAVVFADITQRKKSEEALKQVNETLETRVVERTRQVREQAARLRTLAMELSNAEAREREKLAKVLHDHIQQLMVAARLQLDGLKRTDDAEQRTKAVQTVDETLQEALQASRDLIVDLIPPVLRSSGLISSLEWLASRMQERNGFKVAVNVQTEHEPDGEEAQFLVFECIRELLFNAVKHAGVSEAEVGVTCPHDDRMQITVVDHGKGFDPEDLETRADDAVTFGLFSIRERLTHIGGSLDVDSAPGKGTRFTLCVPIRVTEPGADEDTSDE